MLRFVGSVTKYFREKLRNRVRNTYVRRGFDQTGAHVEASVGNATTTATGDMVPATGTATDKGW